MLCFYKNREEVPRDSGIDVSRHDDSSDSCPKEYRIINDNDKPVRHESGPEISDDFYNINCVIHNTNNRP